MSAFVSYFLPKDQENTLEIIKRSKFLVILTLFLIFFFGINSIIKMAATQEWLVGSIMMCTNLLAGVIFYLIKKGKIKTASNIAMAYLYINVVNLILAIPYIHYLDNYRITLYFVAIILVSSLFFFETRQIYILGALCILAYVFYIIFKHSPHYTPDIEMKAYSAIFAQCFAMLFCIFLSGRIRLFSIELISFANKEKEKNVDKYSSLSKLIDSSQGVINVGSKIVIQSEKTLQDLVQANSGLDNISNDVVNLNSESEGMHQSMQKLKVNSESLNTDMKNFSHFVNEASSAVTQITATVENIEKVTAQRKENTENLVYDVRESKELVDQTANTISDFVERFIKLQQVADMIIGIADKTHVLAMNASIQASHAGKEGRGFTVVAQEIRKLADKTNINAQMVSQELRQNQEFVLLLEKQNKKMTQIFDMLYNETDIFIQSFEEILGGISEINRGLDEINSAVQKMVTITNNTADSTGEIKNEIQKEYESIDQINSLIKHIVNNISDTISSFKKVENVVSNIKDVGYTNIVQIDELTSKIELINE